MPAEQGDHTKVVSQNAKSWEFHSHKMRLILHQGGILNTAHNTFGKDLSMTLAAFTMFHVALSLVGIGSGFVVLYGLLTSKRLDGWTALFLSTTVATSVTGFMFPFVRFLPSHGTGIVSLIVLAAAIAARYIFHLAAPWGRVYAITSVIALYLNVFVLVVQLFQKVPALRALAPTQTEPVFVAAQLSVLALFIMFGVRVSTSLRKQPLRMA